MRPASRAYHRQAPGRRLSKANHEQRYMSQSDACFQLLLPTSTEQLGSKPVGKLTPVSEHENESASFTALDCFDQSLRGSGRLLLETRDGFELLRNEGPLITQRLSGAPRFIKDFSDGELKQALQNLSP